MLLQACMLASLLWTFVKALALVLISLPESFLRCAYSTLSTQSYSGGVVFYEGHVHHTRKQPVYNAFRYPVRMALVSLDAPPCWWKTQAAHFMSAGDAKKLANTDGSVKLLTNPVTAGYVQNPISVYYCYAADGSLARCISEVTNTPWASRVRFLFMPKGEQVPKALHVSPFMDMQNTWHLKASVPGEALSFSVKASHPEHMDYFLAVLELRKSDHPRARSEEAGFLKLLRFGYQPHRDALLIYWQAIKLLWKGVPFYSPPADDYKGQVCIAAGNPAMADGERFHWQPAPHFPWNADQQQ